MKSIIYKFSRKFFLTSVMTKKIESRISILYPATRLSVINKTAEYLIKVYLTSFAAVTLLMFFAEFSVYYSVVVGLVLYALVNNSIYSSLDRLEVRLLMEFQRFLEDVKYRYRFDGMLEEAIQEAINGADYHMAIHGYRIYTGIKDYHFSGDDEYEEIAPNTFFNTFFMMCKNLMIYGDKKVDGESYFIKNISYLKEDIGVELLKRRKTDNLFMGLLGITIIPVFAIKPIEKWSVSNIPELAATYNGIFGILSTLFMAVLSFVIYKIILKLKYPYIKELEKEKWVAALADNEFCKNIVLRLLKVNVKKALSMERNLRNIGYPYDIIEFYIKRIVYAMAAVLTGAMVYVSICMTLRLNVVNVTGIVLILGVGVAAYYYQYLDVKIKERLMRMNREEELVKFQTIVLMLKDTDKITINEILTQMERFSVSFKTILQEILYKLPMGIKVFEEIKGRSGFLGFDRLMDNFRACDYMNINVAFADIEKEREYFIQKHKQDNDFMVEQRSMIGKFISFIPLCAVILAKLIIPFVVEGIKQMSVGNGLIL